MLVRGNVGTIGDIKLKARAAIAAGAKTLVCPAINAMELEGISEFEGLEIHGITTLEKLIQYSIGTDARVPSTVDCKGTCHVRIH
jgi:PDZ domain-containing secreted protein